MKVVSIPPRELCNLMGVFFFSLTKKASSPGCREGRDGQVHPGQVTSLAQEKQYFKKNFLDCAMQSTAPSGKISPPFGQRSWFSAAAEVFIENLFFN